MSQHQHFDVEETGGVTVCRLADALLMDTLVVSGLQDELIEFVETRQPDRLVVDFDAVSQCSTAVINSLLRAKKRLVVAGGQLKICGMRAPIRDAFRSLNLDGTVFQIHSDVADALSAF